MASQIDIRQINRKGILHSLMQAGTATRAGLARATGLSLPTAGKIIDELLVEGAVQTMASLPSAAGRMGRPGFDLRLSQSKSYFLAVQLGVTHTRLAGLSVFPPAEDAWDYTLRTPRSAKRWLSAIGSAARQLITPATKAALISVPGVLDESTGRTILSPNLRWLEGQHIGHALQEAIGVPAITAQEIRCLALGQCTIDFSTENFLLVDFGTGVGSAAVINRRLLEGQLPLSGELGHTPVLGNQLPCGCGGRGCLETLVGRQHFLDMLGLPIDDWFSHWTHAMRKLGENSIPAPFRKTLETAALGISGALNILGLDRVIITGYLSQLPENALNIMRERIQTATMAGRFGMVHLNVAPRRRLAGLASIGIERVLLSA